MGGIQAADELQRVIERRVVEGRAASAAAFIEEAVLRLVDDARLEDEDIDRSVHAGIADIEAGRYTTVVRIPTKAASDSNLIAATIPN